MSKRLQSLDVIRGVAVCGIAFVNIPPIIGLWSPYGTSSVRQFLDLFVQQRFFPIFSLLFGISFGLMFHSAKQKAAHPHRVMLRRILVLGALGALHQVFHPGEALLPYAIAALVLLLPASFIPDHIAKWLCLAAGVVGTLVGAFAGGQLLIPGLFLLGYALALLDVPARVDRIGAWVWLPIVAFGIAGALLVRIQAQLPPEDSLGPIPSYAGLVMAFVYILVLLALMNTPLRSVLVKVFAPMGRMALTNYVMATVVFVAVARIPLGWGSDLNSDSDHSRLWAIAMCIVAGMLAIQSLLSTLWLEAFKQGPLEKAWRWTTWAGESKREPLGAEQERLIDAAPTSARHPLS